MAPEEASLTVAFGDRIGCGFSLRSRSRGAAVARTTVGRGRACPGATREVPRACPHAPPPHLLPARRNAPARARPHRLRARRPPTGLPPPRARPPRRTPRSRPPRAAAAPRLDAAPVWGPRQLAARAAPRSDLPRRAGAVRAQPARAARAREPPPRHCQPGTRRLPAPPETARPTHRRARARSRLHRLLRGRRQLAHFPAPAPPPAPRFLAEPGPALRARPARSQPGQRLAGA